MGLRRGDGLVIKAENDRQMARLAASSGNSPFLVVTYSTVTV